MKLRSVLGSLQLPVAALGAVIAVGSVWQIAELLPIPERGGLPGGLAMLFLYGFGVAGLAVCALGLAIPPGDGFGVDFTRRQRYLFGLSAVGAVGSAVLPVLSLPLAFGGGPEQDLVWVLGLAWLGPLAVSLLALGVALVWRGATAAYAYLEDGGEDADPAT